MILQVDNQKHEDPQPDLKQVSEHLLDTLLLGFGFRVLGLRGLGYRVLGLRGLGFRVLGLRGLGFRGFGFGVLALGFRV